MHGAQTTLTLRQYGASLGSHAHAYFQVLLGVEGALEIEVQGNGRRIGVGEGCVIAPGERHDFEARTGARCLVLDTADIQWTGCVGNPAQSAAAHALAQYLCHTLEQPHSLAWDFGPMLLLDCWRAPVASSVRSKRTINWATLGQWCQDHMHQPLSVADLAQ